MEQRFLKNLDSKVEQKQFYDAHQLCRAIFDRFAKRKDVEGAFNFAEKYAEVFCNEGAYELTVNLGLRSLQMLKDVTTSPSEEQIGRLTTFFVLCPPGSTDTKYDFMNSLITWSKQCPSANKSVGLQSLQALIADAYLADGRFGECQGHIVFCDDVDIMVELVDSWKKHGYPSERDLFVLRLVLILLSRGRVEIAGQLLSKMAVNFEDEHVPAPLQVAWLSWAACDEKCYELLQMLARKFALVLRVDPAFEKLLASIENTVFDKKQASTGIMAMLQGLLGGGAPAISQ